MPLIRSRDLRLAIAFGIAACGLGGRLFNFAGAASWNGGVSMKISTAAALMLVAFSYQVSPSRRSLSGQCQIFASGIMLLTLGGYHEASNEHETVAALVPSLATIACVITLSIACQWRSLSPHFRILSALTASLAFAGHLLHLPPWSYWYYPAISTGMALSTSITILLIASADPHCKATTATR